MSKFDRYIPIRQDEKYTKNLYYNNHDHNSYTIALASVLHQDGPVLEFGPKQKIKLNPKQKKQGPVVESSPNKILDAPNITNDTRFNPIDFGITGHMAVALGNVLYLYDTYESKMTTKIVLDQIIAAVSFSKVSRHIAIGDIYGYIHIYDFDTGKEYFVGDCCLDTICSLSWNGSNISCGCESGDIFDIDIRSKKLKNVYVGQIGCVRDMAWSFDGTKLATCGDDHRVLIWSPKSNQPIMELNGHCGAINSVVWSQYNTLASGGSINDNVIRFWDITNGICKRTIDTKTQLCDFLWNYDTDKIITINKQDKHNVSIWDCKTVTKVAGLNTSCATPTYINESLDGSTICVSGDERILFWSFETNKPAKTSSVFDVEIR